MSEERDVIGRDARGDGEQPDLGGGVEPESEEDAERIHVPARRDAGGEASDEEAVHEAAVEQPRLEPCVIVGAALHLAEDAQDVDEHEQVEDADDAEEGPRDARPDGSAVLLERRDPRADGLRREREPRREREDDRRVSEREEEADAEGALAVLEELPGGVVDRRDVVGVEGVAQPERVREHAEPGQRGVAARVPEEQAPAEDMEQQHTASEAGEAQPFGARQRMRPAGHRSEPAESGASLRR